MVTKQGNSILRALMAIVTFFDESRVAPVCAGNKVERLYMMDEMC